MALTRVTITGADNNTNPQELVNLSRRFPFVEWGILFSKSRTNTARYPHPYYGYMLKVLAEQQGIDIPLSAHICGEWTREFFSGNFSFQNNFLPLHPEDTFDRIQLNFNASKYDYDLAKVLEIIDENHYFKFIFQHNNSNLKLCNQVEGKFENIHFLYDSSGGRGTGRSEWPLPIKNHYTGYAGGLNPSNLIDQFTLIDQVTGPNNIIWIDVETGVRNEKDDLDLNKVIKFLEIAEKYVPEWVKTNNL